MAAVRLQRAAAAKVVVGACDEVHRTAAARVKVGVKRIAVRVDGHQHPLTVGIALKNQLLGLDQHIAVTAPAQRLAARVGVGQRRDPGGQVVLLGLLHRRAQRRVAVALVALHAPFTAVVDRRHTGHTEQQTVDGA